MQHTQADPVEESALSLLLAKPSPQGPTRKRHRFGAKNRIRISSHFFQGYVVFGPKMDHCLNASLLCRLILRDHWQGAIYTQHKHQTTHERLHAWPSPNFDKSQSNHKAPPETPYPVTKVSCQILMKYFMMFAPIIWLWASINFAWILLASRKKTELCENEKQAPDGKKKRKKKKATKRFFLSVVFLHPV